MEAKLEIGEKGAGLLFLDDKFNPALLGVLLIHGRPPTACYDLDGVAQILLSEGMPEGEVSEFINLKLLGFATSPDSPGLVKMVRQKGDLNGFGTGK